MLDSHPVMAVPPESFFITALAERRSTYERSEEFDLEAFTGELTAYYWFQFWEIPAEEVSEALQASRPDSYADAVRAVYSLYASRQGKSRYADKTPEYVHDLPVLAELFPESCFIHIVRDGRDVALSFLEMDFRPHGAAEAALLWRQRVEAARAMGRRLPPERYQELSYEEFAADPERTLDVVCKLVGLEPDAAMLDYPVRAWDVVASDGGPERHPGIFLPPTEGLRDWRTQMAPRDLEVFELIAGGLLEELGYERAIDTSHLESLDSVGILVEELERLRIELLETEGGLKTKLRLHRANRRKFREKQERLEASLQEERLRRRRLEARLDSVGARRKLARRWIGRRAAR